MLSPICLFTYNRLEETKQTVDALQQNFLAPESRLFIFSDGPKNEMDLKKVRQVRDYIKAINGFKKITVIESDVNKGLENSIISGVTKIIKEYEKVIVLEDDLITTPNFLDFMNQALEFYEKEKKVFSISGYTMDLPSLKNYSKDYYMGYRASSWGWATWKDRWGNIDWEVKNYYLFKKNIVQQLKFMRGGSDMPRMLDSQMKGKIDSWAIKWCFDQFNKDSLTIFPSVSKVQNVGFSKNATHTKTSNLRFVTTLDKSNKLRFSFDKDYAMNKKLVKEFKNKFSFYNRIINKFKVI